MCLVIVMTRRLLEWVSRKDYFFFLSSNCFDIHLTFHLSPHPSHTTTILALTCALFTNLLLSSSYSSPILTVTPLTHNHFASVHPAMYTDTLDSIHLSTIYTSFYFLLYAHANSTSDSVKEVFVFLNSGSLTRNTTVTRTVSQNHSEVISMLLLTSRDLYLDCILACLRG